MDQVFVMTERPDRSEAAEYYFTYIDQVGEVTSASFSRISSVRR